MAESNSYLRGGSGLRATFELDFRGKLKSASDVAQARLLATRYSRDVLMLTLASTNAQSYFALRSLDAQIAVTRTSLESRDASLTIVRDRFNAGYAARTAEAEARQRQALASYRKSVETAFRDVADALANIRQSIATEGDLQAAVLAARDALRVAQARYGAGYSAYLDVLDAQRSVNDAELVLARNRQAQLVYTVDLIKATGGGWSPSS